VLLNAVMRNYGIIMLRKSTVLPNNGTFQETNSKRMNVRTMFSLSKNAFLDHTGHVRIAAMLLYQLCYFKSPLQYTGVRPQEHLKFRN